MAAISRAALIVTGPTASGKSEWGMRLADRFNGRLVSVDSALIYRGMDIGTAKPTPAELHRYPHELIDLCDPSESYSVARLVTDAAAALERAWAADQLPILVGGTMLYLHALLHGLAPLPAADPAIRALLQQELAEQGLAALHQQLATVDPQAAATIHPHDPQRILRALEIYRLTGQPMTDLWQHGEAPLLTAPLLLILEGDRAQLHRRIAQRFDQMLAEGFLAEVRGLFERGDLSLQNPSMRCVGYRQGWEHLAGHYDAATFRERAIIATRQLAKRQITWCRSMEGAYRFDREDPASLSRAIATVESYLAA